MLIYRYRMVAGGYEYKNPWGGKEKTFGVEEVLETVYVERSDETHTYHQEWSNKPVTEPVWVDAKGGAYLQYSPVDFGGRTHYHDGVHIWYRPRKHGKYVDPLNRVLIFKNGDWEGFEQP